MTFIEFIEIKKQTLDKEWPNQFNDAKSDLLYHAFKAITQDQGLNLLLHILSTSKTAPTVQAIIKKLEQRDFRPPETVHPLPTCEHCNTTGVVFVNAEEETMAMRCDKCDNHNYFDLPKYTVNLRQVRNPYNEVDKSNWKAVVQGYRNHMRYSSNYWKEQHVQKSTEVQTKRVSHNNQSFASKLEASLYAHLRELEQKKEINNLIAQDTVYLTAARIAYIADFQFEEDGEVVWAEAKGFETDVWRIKRRLWMHYGPGKLLIYKGSYKSITLHETIIPKALNNA